MPWPVQIEESVFAARRVDLRGNLIARAVASLRQRQIDAEQGRGVSANAVIEPQAEARAVPQHILIASIQLRPGSHPEDLRAGRKPPAEALLDDTHMSPSWAQWQQEVVLLLRSDFSRGTTREIGIDDVDYGRRGAIFSYRVARRVPRVDRALERDL